MMYRVMYSDVISSYSYILYVSFMYIVYHSLLHQYTTRARHHDITTSRHHSAQLRHARQDPHDAAGAREVRIQSEGAEPLHQEKCPRLLHLKDLKKTQKERTC